MYDPDTSTNDNQETLIIVGINYYVVKCLIITPNIRFRNFGNHNLTDQRIIKMNFQFEF